MAVLDIGSMCCDCGVETFSVFGPRWKGDWWDDYNCTPQPKAPVETITVKYSFMPEGCSLGHPNCPGEKSLPWEFAHGGITELNFKDQIRAGIGFWEQVFREKFPWLTINFVDLGDEPGTEPSYGDIPVDTNENGIGDIRFGLEDLGSEVLAHAYYTYGSERLGGTGTHAKDVHFNPYQHWRLDGKDYVRTDESHATTSSSGYESPDLLTPRLCPNCTSEEKSCHDRRAEMGEAHIPHLHFEGGFSILWTVVHELGHVFGIGHTDAIVPSGKDSIMYSDIFPDNDISDISSGLDEYTSNFFTNTYDASTVAACNLNILPPDIGRGLIDICEVTVDEGGAIQEEQEKIKKKSPAHLLGTVYYAEERRYDSATIQDLCSISDTLDDSVDHFCPGNPSCRSTLTTWNTEVLYILSPTKAIEKVDLVAEDDEDADKKRPKALWWVYEPDFADSFPDTSSFKAGAFKVGDLSVDFHMGKDSPDSSNLKSQPLGLGRPTGLGWDSSIKAPYGADLSSWVEAHPTGIQVNPDGEFLNERNTEEEATDGGIIDVGLKFGFDCGYGDEGLGFINKIPDNNPKIGRYWHPATKPSGSDPSIDTLCMGEADVDGVASFQLPGHHIQWGWDVPVDDRNAQTDSSSGTPRDAGGEIMTDLAFCASQGSHTKVIPQIVARNSWGHGAGGYTKVETTAETKTAEVIVLASLWGQGLNANTLFLQHNGVPAPYRVEADNLVAVGEKVIEWIEGTALSSKGPWNGKSLTGSGDGSELVLWSAETVGRAVGGMALHRGVGDGFSPIWMPKNIEGRDVWPACVDAALDWSTNGYKVWGMGDGEKDSYSEGALIGIVGYWKIKRKVGVFKHKHESHLVTGAIEASNGSFPYINLDGSSDRKISDVTYYTKPPGMPFDVETFNFPHWSDVSDGKLKDEEFPWAEMSDFPTEIKKEWSYYEPGLTGPDDAPGFDVHYDSKYTGLPNRSGLAYYNRTENKDVFVVEVESVTAGIDPPKYFSATDFPGEHGDYWAPTYTFPTKYHSGPSSGAAPTAGGGTSHGSTPPQADDAAPDESPFKRDECGELNVANISTYERWSAGGGWFLPTPGEEVGTIDFNAGVSTQNLGLYSHIQLWFGDNVVFDTMETIKDFTQTAVNDRAVTNWKVDESYGLVADDTVWVKKRDYPRTELEDIEVLPGDKIAVLTREVSIVDLTPAGWSETQSIVYSPQRLTVINSSGTVVWSQDAAGEPITLPSGDNNEQLRAKIVTSSDRWLHIRGFPLVVDDVIHGEIPEELTLRDTANNWLINLEKGITEDTPAVPARIDEGIEVTHIGRGHNIDNASWASLWDHDGDLETGSDLRDDTNFDAPRASQVIDDCVPDTMHPAEFF